MAGWQLVSNSIKSITGGSQTVEGIKSIATSFDGTVTKLIKDVLTQPMVDLVPIEAVKITVNREVDIANTMVISQYDNSREYITDNVAPHPRIWNIVGYITSLAPEVESFLLIKPSLLLQKRLLDKAANSRVPIVFKTDEGEVISQALVKSLVITKEANAMNTYSVEIAIQELSVLKAEVEDKTTLSSPLKTPVKTAGDIVGNELPHISLDTVGV